MTDSFKMVQHSDGALTEITVMDELVTAYHAGEDVSLDDILTLNKKAMDHLKNLRALIKRGVTS